MRDVFLMAATVEGYKAFECLFGQQKLLPLPVYLILWAVFVFLGVRRESRDEAKGAKYPATFLLLLVFAIPLSAQQVNIVSGGVFAMPQPADPTQCYVNQVGVLTPLDNQHGKVRGIGSAHGVAIVGDDGILYGLYDECLPSAPLSRYQKPQDSAGPKAIGWWQFFNGPQNLANRCRSLLIGSTAGDPPAPDPCNTGGAASICLWAQPPNGTFHPAIVSCGGTPPTPTPVPTPAPNIYAAWIEAAVKQGYMSPCGTNLFCPGDSVQISSGYVTRAQMAVFLMKAVHGPSYVPPPCTGMFTDARCGS